MRNAVHVEDSGMLKVLNWCHCRSWKPGPRYRNELLALFPLVTEEYKYIFIVSSYSISQIPFPSFKLLIRHNRNCSWETKYCKQDTWIPIDRGANYWIPHIPQLQQHSSHRLSVTIEDSRKTNTTRRQYASMSEKAGLSGSHPVTMPNRQVSTSSAMSNDAIPTTDPKDVRVMIAWGVITVKLIGNADLWTSRRTSASMEARSWLPRGLRECDREGTESSSQGIWEGVEGQSWSYPNAPTTTNWNSIDNPKPIEGGAPFWSELGWCGGIVWEHATEYTGRCAPSKVSVAITNIRRDL